LAEIVISPNRLARQLFHWA